MADFRCKEISLDLLRFDVPEPFLSVNESASSDSKDARRLDGDIVRIICPALLELGPTISGVRPAVDKGKADWGYAPRILVPPCCLNALVGLCRLVQIYSNCPTCFLGGTASSLLSKHCQEKPLES